MDGLTKVVKAKPDGYHAITLYLVIDGASRLIDFLEEVFDAEEVERKTAPGDRIGRALHAASVVCSSARRPSVAVALDRSCIGRAIRDAPAPTRRRRRSGTRRTAGCAAGRGS